MRYKSTNSVNNKRESFGNVTVIYKRLQKDDKLVTTVKDLDISGNDIILLGVKRGKIIGDLLNKLLELVLNSKLDNNHKELLEMAKNLVNAMENQG